ncbi:Phosphatidylinositol/phosphatidylcholine transfer protein [Nymphaea thermarum]|nr:Phosphatidylinositol/phosphatidylcholine transfer protein [Nymphaea thermarum]
MSGSGNLELSNSSRNKQVSGKCSVASSSKKLLPYTFKRLMSLDHAKFGKETALQVGSFLLKLAALEVVRKISKARCPFLWQAVQGLYLLTYPPFRFLQRWKPFRFLIEGSQKMSRPLLFLSIATVFTDQYDEYNEASNIVEPVDTSMMDESPDGLVSASSETAEETGEIVEPESWLSHLKGELQKQGIVIPERIDEDELQRFYAAANNDFLCFVSSIKKTIQWREAYRILSKEELEAWSHLVFWHGFDVKLRPCLIIRLGCACLSLDNSQRPRFAQAVVSQVEYGIMNLVNKDDPRITVVLDCERISALRFPMKMMKYCSTLMQDHYPNRLASLLVIRLPPVVRLLAQTFIQLLKPVTRQKLHIEGDKYIKILSEHLQTIPLLLGGCCRCAQCSALTARHTCQSIIDSNEDLQPSDSSIEVVDNSYMLDQLSYSGHCDKVLRTAILSILMLWIVIALIAGIHDSEQYSLFP